MKKEFKLLPPTMPNFIMYDDGVIHTKQEGFNPKQGIPIETLTESEAMSFAALMTKEFYRHWSDKRRKYLGQLNIKTAIKLIMSGKLRNIKSVKHELSGLFEDDIIIKSLSDMVASGEIVLKGSMYSLSQTTD
jgi:hypothetical protein